MEKESILMFSVIHSIDSLDIDTSVSGERKQFKGIGLKETECYKGEEAEYSYLFKEQGLKPKNIIYHLKFHGFLTLKQFRKYMSKFYYLEAEKCDTMGSLIGLGCFADIPFRYYDYYKNIEESVRIAPLVHSEWQFNKIREALEKD